MSITKRQSKASICWQLWGHCNPYLQIIFALAIVVGIVNFLPTVSIVSAHGLEAASVSILFIVSLLFVLSFIVFYISQNTSVPSFVIAIFFGMATHNVLRPLLSHPEAVQIIVILGATLILFGGGLETPFRSFKKLFGSIISLALLGVGMTAFILSIVISVLSRWSDGGVSVAIALLLGAVLASTDPAAIIPTLKHLRFKHSELKDLIISESALTDVSGALLALTFLTYIATTAGTNITIYSAYTALFSFESLQTLAVQASIGILFGCIGYLLLHFLVMFKKRHSREFEADAALFLCVPIFVFVAAESFEGSGYLATFVAGLLFHVSDQLRETERFFNHIIDGFLKVTIFILLGALIDVPQLLEYAFIGVGTGIIFMFVVRPLAVFVSLAPFLWFQAYPFTVRDLVFMSWVRETGAIPAVLLVSIAALGLPGSDALLPIGAWIILLTLTIQPALTPWVAKKLQVAECITDKGLPILDIQGEQVVVLASRGNSYLRRLPKVADWAIRHGVQKIIVLMCPEDAYSEQLIKEKKAAANQKFLEINDTLQKDKNSIKFSILCRKGFLQTNINTLAREEAHISAFFVGKRMLDYKLEDIKSMKVPFFFMD